MPEPTDVLSTDSGTAARNSAEEVNGRSSSSSDQSEMDSWLLEFIDKQYFMRNLLKQKSSPRSQDQPVFPMLVKRYQEKAQRRQRARRSPLLPDSKPTKKDKPSSFAWRSIGGFLDQSGKNWKIRKPSIRLKVSHSHP